MVNKNLKVGAHVWRNTTWNGICEEIIKSECKELASGVKYYELKGISIVGSSAETIDNLFLSKDEVIELVKVKRALEKDALLAEIISVPNLINLMYSKIKDNEYPDYIALDVIKDKVKELLGIEL